MMYGWLYRHLPGSTPVKITCAVLLGILTVLLLMFVVFPWVEPHVPINRVTVNQ